MNRTIVALSLAIGLAIRLAYLLLPPASSTRWDHHEYVRWGILMREEGFTALYDHPPRETLMWNHGRGVAETARHPEHFICNYPPLAAYVLYAQISVLGWVDSTLASNTRAARLIYGALPVLGDVLIAAGCFALVRRLTNAPDDPTPGCRRRAPAAAFAAVMLAPPFFLDSARWTQTDSWVLAPAVWMLAAMLAGRWTRAGLLWGLAMGLKTQGILFAPVWLLAFLGARDRKRVVAGGLLAALVLVIPALPFMLHSGGKWFEEAYVNNLLKSYKLTTLQAFNLWYLDLLITEDPDAGAKRLGLEKDTCGKLMLAAAVIGCGWALARRRRQRPDWLIAFTALMLLAAVILPARVHERYILLPIPFLIVMACLRPRVWWGLAPFVLVASFQMTVLDWLGVSAASWSKIETKVHRQYEALRQTLPPEQFAALPPPEVQLSKVDRPRYEAERAAMGREKWEWTLTLLQLLSAIALAVLVLLSQRSEARGQKSKHQVEV